MDVNGDEIEEVAPPPTKKGGKKSNTPTTTAASSKKKAAKEEPVEEEIEPAPAAKNQVRRDKQVLPIVCIAIAYICVMDEAHLIANFVHAVFLCLSFLLVSQTCRQQ